MLMAVMLAAVLAAASCSSRPSAAAPVRFAASRSIAANGLSVTVFVSRQQLGIADRLEVLIEARRCSGHRC
jgi:acyl-homoserine lactone acylase PvdQ